MTGDEDHYKSHFQAKAKGISIERLRTTLLTSLRTLTISNELRQILGISLAIQRHGWLSKLGNWLTRWTLAPMAAFTALSGAFLTFDWNGYAKAHPGASAVILLAGDWIAPIFFFASLSTLLLSIVDRMQQPNLKRLAREVELIGENFRTLCDGLLTDLGKRLDFGEKTEDRCSLYIHDGGCHFVLFGRYSHNPKLAAPGRPQYPDSEGCIARGWEHSWHFEDQIKPGRGYKNAVAASYGIPAETIENIKMKSIFYAVKRIEYQNKNIAALVVESTTKNRFSEDYIRKVLDQFCADYGELIFRFKHFIPEPSIARKAGF